MPTQITHTRFPLQKDMDHLFCWNNFKSNPIQSPKPHAVHRGSCRYLLIAYYVQDVGCSVLQTPDQNHDTRYSLL